jgi:hypothetical protein
MKTAISPLGPRFGLMGSAGSPGLTSEVGARSSFPSKALHSGTGLSSSREAPGMGTGISLSVFFAPARYRVVKIPRSCSEVVL